MGTTTTTIIEKTGTNTGTCAVVIGGGPITSPVGDHDLVIAADGGYDAARSAGVDPHVLVGDLDSISAAGLAWAETHGVDVQRHAVDKDRTDTALALTEAVASAPNEIVLYGPTAGDRLDHLLGAIIALGSPELASTRSVSAHFGGAAVHVVHPGHTVELTLTTGTVFSLLALHGPCAGITVSGARWALSDAVLVPGSTVGISNEADGTSVVVSVATGVLTVIIPEVLT